MANIEHFFALILPRKILYIYIYKQPSWVWLPKSLGEKSEIKGGSQEITVMVG